MQRWIHPEKRRYYQVQLVEDLFGDWTVIACWGGLDSHRGGMQVKTAESYEAAQEQIEMIGKRRRQRGYERVGGAEQG